MPAAASSGLTAARENGTPAMQWHNIIMEVAFLTVQHMARDSVHVLVSDAQLSHLSLSLSQWLVMLSNLLKSCWH